MNITDKIDKYLNEKPLPADIKKKLSKKKDNRSLPELLHTIDKGEGTWVTKKGKRVFVPKDKNKKIKS